MSGNWYDDPDAEVERPGAKPPAKPRRTRAPRTNNNGQRRGGEPTADEKICGVKLSNQKGVCRRPAGYGTEHLGYGPCYSHFGSTPAGRKSGAYDMGEELMVFYGKPVDTNPVDALLDEVKRTAGHVAWLGKVIGTFGFEVIDKDTKELNEIPPEALGYLALYNQERGQLVRVSKAALDAGVNERLVQLAEHQGLRLADAVNTILDALQLTAAQRELVPRVVPDVLRGLMNNEPPRLITGTIEGELEGE